MQTSKGDFFGPNSCVKRGQILPNMTIFPADPNPFALLAAAPQQCYNCSSVLKLAKCNMLDHKGLQAFLDF